MASDGHMEAAKASAIEVAKPHRHLSNNLKAAAGAMSGWSKSAYANLVKRRADLGDIVLRDDNFSIPDGAKTATIAYTDVKHIKLHGDKLTVSVKDHEYNFKPFAYLVAGRVKVPIGWDRDGTEVPYETFGDELAARCQKEVERA